MQVAQLQRQLSLFGVPDVLDQSPVAAAAALAAASAGVRSEAAAAAAAARLEEEAKVAAELDAREAEGLPYDAAFAEGLLAKNDPFPGAVVLGAEPGVHGALEELEALVAHDKRVMAVHGAVLFRRVEVGLKRVLVERRLATMKANVREASHTDHAAAISSHVGTAPVVKRTWSVEDAHFFPGDLDPEGWDEQPDNGNDGGGGEGGPKQRTSSKAWGSLAARGDRSVGGGSDGGGGGGGRAKLLKALTHYAASLARSEQRLLARLDVVRVVHHLGLAFLRRLTITFSPCAASAPFCSCGYRRGSFFFPVFVCAPFTFTLVSSSLSSSFFRSCGGSTSGRRRHCGCGLNVWKFARNGSCPAPATAASLSGAAAGAKTRWSRGGHGPRRAYPGPAAPRQGPSAAYRRPRRSARPWASSAAGAAAAEGLRRWCSPRRMRRWAPWLPLACALPTQAARQKARRRTLKRSSRAARPHRT